MKANEFVKKFGWARVKNCNKPSSRDDFFIVGGEVIRGQDLKDLKRLVESKAWVDEHGTIERAKEYANSPYAAPEIKERLLQAIADVEGCQ